jgi:hypothetical protein
MARQSWFERSAARNQAWADEQRRKPPPTEEDMKRELRRAFDPRPHLAGMVVAATLGAVLAGAVFAVVTALFFAGLAAILVVGLVRRRRRFTTAAERASRT